MDVSVGKRLFVCFDTFLEGGKIAKKASLRSKEDP